MKDEFKENIISEFVGLNSKVYSLIVRDGEEIKKAKGVNKNVVKNERQKEFILKQNLIKNWWHNMKKIQSKLHRIGTYDVCKISLSFFDDKKKHIKWWH